MTDQPTNLGRFDDPSPAARLVWGVWGVMTVGLFALVAFHGVNLPIEDDWEGITPLLLDSGRIDLAEAWKAENEHRLPLPKLAWMSLASFGVFDFRVSMWLNALLLSGACGVILLALRRASGRLHWPDVAIPVLMLNWTHACNVTFAIQLHFVLAAVLACLALAIVTATRGRPSRPMAIAYALCVACLPFASAIGIVLSVPLACWLLVLATDREVTWTGRAGLVAATLGIWLVAYAAFVPRLQSHPAAEHAGVFVLYVLRLLAMSFGRAVGAERYLISTIVVVFLALVGRRLLERSPERMRTAGLAVFLGAFVLLAAAVAHGRSGYGVDGAYAVRYTTMMLPVALAVYLLGRLASEGSPPQLVRNFALLAMLLLPINSWKGYHEMAKRNGRAAAMLSDLEAGVPHHELVRRHAAGVHMNPPTVESRLLELRQAGVPPFDRLVVVPPERIATEPANPARR